MSNSWTTIESDPGVFTQLIKEMGVEGILVEEIYDLSEEALENLKPVYGLIFLFNWEKNDAPVDMDAINNMFFAKQKVQNACATQAILGILLNKKEIKLGEELEKFKENTKDLDPTMKGIAIGENEHIRKVHNSFKTQEPFESDERIATSKDDVFHFISYVPVNGSLMEIDGLKDGPINHGECTEENWLSKVKPVIEKRIAQYQTSEIRFNLMAVTKDPLEEYQNEMKEISQKIQTLEKEGSNIAQLEAAKMDKQDILDKIHAHEAKLNRYAIENARRRHNWFPFIIELLNILAKKGKLEPAIAASQEKTKKRREEKRQRLANANANATSSEQK
ncbi:ubiquitinyl hydrolase [Neocallimastix lanati (nom. inval.)]|jgi:ubiquitin carboxyl-terminal hydrolase L5|uniref:Ubiquitin carboxyl-terminal hydrolase n=1 Tax=Neocallimastix californiae TaxID=1754190 RepID=A0A1Y2EPV6_9FUNG|nr:ubiquitinyl hydrolase [Neocallimastix sp. JGI-2020a]ORY73557.1 ubiquitinyl hydrolase [Neocallimastix californiae]|eukprot:ORY73557.1 ubiquitinyl hydrolase [Neocallimastix californiae]